MERRVLLAVFLSFLVLVGYQALFVESVPDVELPAADGRESALPEAVVVPPPAAVDPGTATTPPSDPPDAPAALVADTEVREVVVETPHVRAVFSNQGAVLQSWVLKRYRTSAGEPVDLIPSNDARGSFVRPFTLVLGEGGLTERLTRALFRADRSGVSVTDTPQSVAFEFRDTAGLAATKTFRFDPAAPYTVDVSTSVEQGGSALNPKVAWGPGLGDDGAGTDLGQYVQPPAALIHMDGDAERLDASDVAEQAVYEGRFPFAGIDDHYFLAVALPGGSPVRVEYAAASIADPGGAEEQRRQLMGFVIGYDAPPDRTRFLVGPKDFELLRAADAELVRAIDFGIFGFLVVPLLLGLKWIYGFVGNYGWSIILMTVLINGAMFPLRHKSVVSMRKMQEIQPEIKAIQDRYGKLKATDPARQKMNADMMNLYRERGVNPASGCVPMLLTMPVLFAFYSLLSVSIEIRGAPFVLWIMDLSRHDPWYVTPLLMGASMVWQQKLTPTPTADPVQQKVMMIMPLMFTVMFLWAPSGLVIYWLVSNMLAIGQQYVTNRIIGPPVVWPARPAAERRLKNAGARRG